MSTDLVKPAPVQVDTAPPQTSCFFSIPYELLHDIFTKLKLNDIHSLLLTNHEMSNNILTDRVLWRKRLRNDFPLFSSYKKGDPIEFYKNGEFRDLINFFNNKNFVLINVLRRKIVLLLI